MFFRVKNIVMWALTYRCNMTCNYCFLRNKVKNWKELSDDECIKVAEFIAQDTTWRPDAVWLTGGEPTVKSCLPEIISILESSGIRCVITSNGLCDETVVDKILEATPRGINISLESVDDEKNDKFRGYTKSVIKTIKTIVEKKSKYTLLGISSVVSQNNTGELLSFSKEISDLGVDYLSINPLIGNSITYNSKQISDLFYTCKQINGKFDLITPSDYYFYLLESYLSKKMPLIKCPSGNHYFFISPWGKCYPCSNEIWQKSTDSIELISEYGNIKNVFLHIQESFRTDSLTTHSSCFGDRCIGCWKLYYDDVFT